MADRQVPCRWFLAGSVVMVKVVVVDDGHRALAAADRRGFDVSVQTPFKRPGHQLHHVLFCRAAGADLPTEPLFIAGVFGPVLGP
ncbi:hypothetical protein D3C75_1182280 [compost metagenome]